MSKENTMFQGMEYVYEVYLEKSFSKAAEKLFISQPSLSANVKRVEHHIGYPIFEPGSTKPLSLTECGVQYIKAVEKIKSIQNEFEGFANDWGDLKKGTLTLGGSNLFSSWILPPLIADFARRYPLIQISLIEETTGQSCPYAATRAAGSDAGQQCSGCHHLQLS